MTTTTNDAPRLSAIVPTFNGARFLEETLRSIGSQTVPVDEIVVVDDGSTDDSLAIVAATCPEARIVAGHEREGAARARARGVVASTGHWLAFCDHDDLWPVGRTAALLAATDEAHWVCGRVRLLADDDTVLSDRLLAADLTHIPYLLSSALVRRSVWEQTGGIDARWTVGEDVDLYLRFRETGGRATLIDDITLDHRMHGGSLMSARSSSAAGETFDVIRAAAQRRRRAQASPDAT